jgi:hypothetical protein
MQDWDGTTAVDTAQDYHNGETEYYSDASQELSEENEEPPDDLVAEDMRRLESSFVGISKRFRLINRIGEGQIRSPVLSRNAFYSRAFVLQGRSQPFTRPKISFMITTSTTGSTMTLTPIRTNAAGWGRIEISKPRRGLNGKTDHTT